MKLTEIDKANIELVQILKTVNISLEESSGVMKNRMASFAKLARNEVLYCEVNDDGSLTFTLV